jgi:hypothetical protein
MQAACPACPRRAGVVFTLAAPTKATVTNSVIILAGKMRAGISLTDEDRLPWLQDLAAVLRKHVDR